MTPCIEYQGHRDKDGYGRQYNPATQRQTPAHRMAWEAVFGAIPDGMVVRHRCDNPPCINVEHLELGTQAQNQQDVVLRGRLGLRKGETNNQATLTDLEVAHIRAAYTGKRGELTALGRQYNTSRTTIKWIVTNRRRA